MHDLLGLNGIYGLNDLIFQLLIVIIPITIYQLFWIEKSDSIETKNKKIISILFYAITILLCMLFPIHYDPEHRFDLRMIPLTIGFLYHGHRGGFLLIIWILFLRILFGGFFGIVHAIMNLALYAPILFLVSKSFLTYNRVKKIKVYLFLNFFYFLCFLITSIFDDFILSSRQSTWVFITFAIISLASSLIIITFIESMQEKLRMKEELQRSEKTKLLSDLTGVFAHEIRNPMQVARGFLQLLNESDLSESKQGYIKISIEELDRANMIINDLLTFAKPTTDEKKEVNIKDELLRVINITHTFSNVQDVHIETNLSGNCWVIANPQRLDQCFINILKNAIEAMPEGGQIFITCFPTREGYAQIQIKDQGIGMTKEQIDSLGTPFFSLKKDGTGLGMMITNQIVKSYNGEIKFESELEQGTTVSIFLPRYLPKLNTSLNSGLSKTKKRTLSDSDT